MRSFGPDGALPLFIGGGDHKVVGGCKIYTARHATYNSLLTTHCFCTPSPAELVPSPYKQGESAVRTKTPQGFLITHYLLLTTYYLLLTPHYSLLTTSTLCAPVLPANSGA